MGVANATAWDSGIQASVSPPSRAGAGLPGLADEKLMQAYQAGDGRAFEILYARHRAPLFRFLQRLVSGLEADEVFQEVWLAVVKGRGRYQPSARFTTFLFTIAHHRAMDKFRANGRPFFVDAPEDAVDVMDENLGPLSVTLNAELGEALNAAIAQLPLPQREAFLMQAEGDLSLDEIAEASAVSRETVKSRLRYAHRRLRQSLEDWK